MINSITITDESFLKRSKLSTINFTNNTNILIGPNGCGKSSVISLLISTIDSNLSHLTKYRDLKYTGKFTIYYKDFEKENPRTQDYNISKTPVLNIISHFNSHGETNIGLINCLKKIKEPVCIIMDEPELALDSINLIKVKKIFDNLSDFCQIIVSTHNPILWSIKNANLIEFSEGYIEKTIKAYNISISKNRKIVYDSY